MSTVGLWLRHSDSPTGKKVRKETRDGWWLLLETSIREPVSFNFEALEEIIKKDVKSVIKTSVGINDSYYITYVRRICLITFQNYKFVFHFADKSNCTVYELRVNSINRTFFIDVSDAFYVYILRTSINRYSAYCIDLP